MSADNTPRDAQEDSADNADMADCFFVAARVWEESLPPAARVVLDAFALPRGVVRVQSSCPATDLTDKGVSCP